MAVIAAATTLPDGIIKPSVLSLINPSSSKNRALSTNISLAVDETSQ